MTNSIIYINKIKNLRTKGILFAMFGALLISFDSIFIRFSGVSGYDTSFLFGLFTAISMSIVIQLRDNRGLVRTLKDSGWPLLLSGLLMLGSASGLVFSVKNTSISNTIVILSSTAALSAVFSWFIMGEMIKRSTAIAILLVMIGIAIVVSGSLGSGKILGDLLAVFAAICLSLNQTILRKFKGISRLASVGMGGLFLAIIMFTFASPSTFSINTWIIMGAMGLFTAPFGRVMSQTATRFITAPEVGLILMINAVLSPIWAYVFFMEVPPTKSLIGGTLIIITILSYTIFTMKQNNVQTLKGENVTTSPPHKT